MVRAVFLSNLVEQSNAIKLNGVFAMNHANGSSAMKTLLAFLLVLAAVVNRTATAQNQIVGNGQIVKQQRSLGAFDKLNVRVGMRVRITEGDAATAELEGESNILEHVQTDIRNGELTVMLKPNQSYNQTKGVTVTIHVPKLEQIAVSTGCAVESDLPIRANTLTATVETGSRLSAPVDTKILNLTVQQGSQARLRGTATEADIRLSGAGKLEAGQLTIDRATVRLNGASNASLHVTKTLSAVADGVSTVSYRGNPTVTEQQATGLSKIRKQG